MIFKKKSKKKKEVISKRSAGKVARDFTRAQMTNDLEATYPYDGKFLKVGDREVLLTKSGKKDEDGDPIYIGTVVKRKGLSRRKVDAASHIQISRL